MTSIVRIKREGSYLQQAFVQMGEKHCDDLIFLDSQVVKEGNPSVVAILAEQALVLKLIKPRSWHEFFKLLWGRSRVSKEIKGGLILRSIGINTPRIIESGYGFFPSRSYQFLGYLVMEDLHAVGYQDAFDCVRFGQISSAARNQMMLNICKDIKRMRENRILFSDLKLNNIFSDGKGAIAWIDTGVTTFSRLSEGKYKRKFNHSLNRFLRMYSEYLSDREILLFQALFL